MRMGAGVSLVESWLMIEGGAEQERRPDITVTIFGDRFEIETGCHAHSLVRSAFEELIGDDGGRRTCPDSSEARIGKLEQGDRDLYFPERWSTRDCS